MLLPTIVLDLDTDCRFTASQPVTDGGIGTKTTRTPESPIMAFEQFNFPTGRQAKPETAVIDLNLKGFKLFTDDEAHLARYTTPSAAKYVIEPAPSPDPVTLRHRPDCLDLPGELWQPLPFAPDRYQVSDLGRVKSTYWRGTRILCPVNRRVMLTISTHNLASIYVARLVAYTFLGPLLPGSAIRFLDGDRDNPALSNLIIEKGTPFRKPDVICPAWAPVRGVDFEV